MSPSNNGLDNPDLAEASNTSSMALPGLRRLDKRLEAIFQWASLSQYDDIYDLCCDHGRLGIHLHRNFPEARVHLVDQVPKIIHALKSKFHYLDQNNIRFTCAKAEALSFDITGRKLFIIAGVGGETAIEILNSLLEKIHNKRRLSGAVDTNGVNTVSRDLPTIDFIISPNSHVYHLRKYLRLKRLSLVDEAFIQSNGRYHEHLWLKYSTDALGMNSESLPIVSAVGEKIWQLPSAIHKDYIQKLLQHYTRVSQHHACEMSKEALVEYKKLQCQLFSS